MLKLAPIAAVVLLLGSLASAQADPGAAGAATPAIKIAVPDMAANGVDPQEARTLTELIVVEANQVEGLEVIGMSDIRELLGLEREKQLLGCDDVSCIAEIGGALGVQYILASQVGKVGDSHVLTLRLIDTAQARLAASASATVAGDAQLLLAVIPDKVPPLVRRALPNASAAAPAPSVTEGAPLLWPAIAVTSLGGVMAIAGAVLVTVAAVNYASHFDTVVVADDTYAPTRTLTEFQAVRGSGIPGVSLLGVGLLTAVGGAVWWALAAPADGEVAP